MKKFRICLYVILFFSCICIIVYALMYPGLPDTIPIHWSVQGSANGFIPKELFLALPVGISVICLYSLNYYKKANCSKQKDQIGVVLILSIFLVTTIGILIYYLLRF